MFYAHKESAPCGQGQEILFHQHSPISLGETFSMYGDHPKGSVKIETSLLLPKQLIHRKGNCPLLNFLSIRLTVSMIRREKLPWTTSILDITERKRGEKRANAWINFQGTFGRNITILNIYISRKTLDFAIELIVQQFTFTWNRSVKLG